MAAAWPFRWPFAALKTSSSLKRNLWPAPFDCSRCPPSRLDHVRGCVPSPFSSRIRSLGKWQWTRSANQCTEVNHFRADRTAQVVSGTEKTSNVYTVAPQPDASGFYRLTLKIVKDQGGKDCSDDTRDSVGQSNTLYVTEPSNERHMVCAAASPERCVGPLRRIK